MTAKPSPDAPRPDLSGESLARLPARIVLFDGVCAFCDGLIPFLIERDTELRLHYAPQQGPTAAIVRDAFPGEFPTGLDTIVFLDQSGGNPRLLIRSAAMMAVAEQLGGAWGLIAWLRVLPRPLTDWLYMRFAENRYRWFGELDECRVPSPAERDRVLD